MAQTTPETIKMIEEAIAVSGHGLPKQIALLIYKDQEDYDRFAEDDEPLFEKHNQAVLNLRSAIKKRWGAIHVYLVKFNTTEFVKWRSIDPVVNVKPAEWCSEQEPLKYRLALKVANPGHGQVAIGHAVIKLGREK